MKFLFWFSVICVLYTYIGYPFILMVIVFVKDKLFSLFSKYSTLHTGLNSFNPAPHMLPTGFYPSVSIIIAAYNEDNVIRDKIEKILNLDYPPDKLEIIVASDASTDKTDDIVKEFTSRGVILVRQKTRGGKTSVQNLAVKYAKGEILVFSDATTVFDNQALKKLVRNFKNPSVGCVGGEEYFVTSPGGISEEAGFFWKYERKLRRLESSFNTMIGVSGCIFAIRKELYERLDDTLIEDFVLPLKVAGRGFKVMCEREARAYEYPAKSVKDEFRRKARIVSGGINVVVKMKYLLNPFKYPALSFEILSHKICRWLVPLFMVSLLISNLFLWNDNAFFRAVLLLQLCFYALAFVGYFYRKIKLLKFISHFCLMNITAVLGMIRFIKGEKKVIWEPVR